MKRKVTFNNTPVLINETRVRVRFSEVDSMRIVWHGEYVKYFEDGREAFGREYQGLGYMDLYESGYSTPIVDMTLQFKKPLHIGELITVETRYINTGAAKILFEYIIRRDSDNEIVATGTSMQVFVNDRGELELTSPDFYLNWKNKWGIK